MVLQRLKSLHSIQPPSQQSTATIYICTLIVEYPPSRFTMNAFYKPVRILLVIVLAVSLVLNILNLIEAINGTRDVGIIVIMVIQILTVLLGFLGAYNENRQQLITFSLIVIVALIVAIILSREAYVIGNVAVNVITVLLALWQAHMIGDLTSPLF